PEAIGHYEQAVRLKPDYAQNNPAFASALASARETAAAMERYQKILLAKPDDADAHTELGNLLGQIGRVPEAISHYEQVLRQKPDSAQTHYNLGMAMAAIGKAPESIEHYRQAIRLAPNFVLGMNNLAWLLATHADPAVRDGAEAVRLAERACQLADRKAPGLLDTLAAAYAEAGRFPDAVATAEEALALAKSMNPPAGAADIQARLTLYRAGKCYRDVPAPAAAPGRK
ncbi:MAG: tetratricopeptide repeat protein, partial [Planctomycetota bacterium]|nr:tetratricopeptide repeat protein [Planctomycetota bacterium]